MTLVQSFEFWNTRVLATKLRKILFFQKKSMNHTIFIYNCVIYFCIKFTKEKQGKKHDYCVLKLLKMWLGPQFWNNTICPLLIVSK